MSTPMAKCTHLIVYRMGNKGLFGPPCTVQQVKITEKMPGMKTGLLTIVTFHLIRPAQT